MVRNSVNTYVIKILIVLCFISVKVNASEYGYRILETTPDKALEICLEKHRESLCYTQNTLDRNPDLRKERIGVRLFPLHGAAYSGSLDLMRMLLDKDPTLIDQTGEDGLTALHYAVLDKLPWRADSVSFLISRGANTQAQSTQNKKTPLDLIRKTDPDYAKLVALLNAKTTSPSCCTIAGTTPDQALTQCCLTHIASMDMIKNILAKNPDLRTRDGDLGRLPLHFAACAGSLDLMRLLLDKDPTLIHQTGPAGITVLHFAILRKLSWRVGSVAFLISRGADTQVLDAYNRRALDYVETTEPDYAQLAALLSAKTTSNTKTKSPSCCTIS